MSIVVVGSVNADIVIRVDEFAELNETVLTDGGYVLSQGGKGANQAAAAAHAGAQVTMIGRIGDDELGERAAASLESVGIDCRHLRITMDGKTGIAAIIVNARGDNCITVAAGANSTLSPDDIADASATIADAKVLMLQLEVPIKTVAAAIRAARESCGPAVILNPAPAPSAALEFLHEIDILVPNQSEARQMAAQLGVHSPDPKAQARALLAAGARNVIVTLGEDGCLWAGAEGIRRFAAHRVDVVDTTGAGDTFCGFLGASLARGDAIPQAIALASAASAIAVSRPQARLNMPSLAEATALLESQLSAQ